MIKRNLIGVILLLVVGSTWFLCIKGLLTERFIPTHDGEYHLIRIYEFSKELRRGNIIPRWASGLNSGHGFPLFIFHYPFPNYIGSMLHLLGLPLVQSFQFALALGYSVAVLACGMWINARYKQLQTALLGIMVCLTIPYWYVDIYIRGSIGEIWGLAFTFLSLWSIQTRKNMFTILCCSGLILSHNIMAFVMLPIIMGYLIIQDRKKIWLIGASIISTTYFWLPALYESKYVFGLNTVSFVDHFPTYIQLIFPSWGSMFSQSGMIAGELSQQIGVVGLVLLVSFIFYVLQAIFKKEYPRAPLVTWYFFTCWLVSIWLMTPTSIFVWHNFPVLQYIQYPWRLLSVGVVVIPLLAADYFQYHKRITSIVVGIALLFTLQYVRPVSYEPRNDAYYVSRREFTDGTSSMGNSLSTIWSGAITQRESESMLIASGSGSLQSLNTGPTSITFSYQADTDSIIKVNRTYYPGWKVDYNGKSYDIRPNDGRIEFNLPAGQGEGSVVFGTTLLRSISNAISISIWLILCILIIYMRLYANRNSKQIVNK